MNNKTHNKTILLTCMSLAAAVLLIAGCSSTLTGGGSGSGAAFVVGTDAPMADVVSFSVPVNSITVTPTGGGTPVNLLAEPTTVDFARFNGLKTLLDLNDIPTGSYSDIVISLGQPTLGTLVTGGGAPTISTTPVTYPTGATTYTYTDTLANPLVVTATQPVGLRIDLDLHQTLTVSGGSIVTTNVTPVFDLKAVGINDVNGDAYIDDFVATVDTVDAAANTFTITGPHGRSFTINAASATFENSSTDTINTLVAGSIVAISGSIDRADSTFDANDIAILTTTGFWAGGLVTYVNPTTPNTPATSFDMYVRGLLGGGTGINLGDIATVELNGSEDFFIYRWHSALTQLVFNSSRLLPGQHVSIGGPASGATNENAVTVNRVVLRHWGFNGTFVASSITPPVAGVQTFQMNINGFDGSLITPQPVTVYVDSAITNYRGGLTQITDLNNVPVITSGSNVRVVGLLIENGAGNPIILAHYVDELQ